MQNYIGIHDPWITEREKQEVTDALASNWLSGAGQKVTAFERAVQEFFSYPTQPIATVNGSAALLLGLRVAGVQPGDRVLVSDYGFVASANAIRHLGAEPVFIGPDSPEAPYVSFSRLQAFFGQQDPSAGPVKGMVYNQPYGLSCPQLAAVATLLREHGAFLLEDSSQAMGVAPDRQLLGTFGDFAVFSLNGNKTITTGAGGLLLARNAEDAARARRLSSQSRSDDFDFFYGEVAYNFQMPNTSAAIGLAQAQRLPEILEKKKRIRALYREKLSSWRLLAAESLYPAWLNVALSARPGERPQFRALATALEEKGIRVRPAFPPVSANPAYAGAKVFQGEHSSYLFQHGICLPSGPTLTELDVGKVVQALEECGKALGLV